MEDTIAAIATAYGEGGIGIVRISGENSKQILSEIFRPEGKAKSENRKLVYGYIYDEDTIIDEVMAVYMDAPNTYTREDVVEIDCHGSIVSLKKILSLTLKKGARLAEPGEFTKRAFLNGRIDLSQAEAVMDLIKAKTDRTFDIAVSQLEGVFSNKIREIRDLLRDILVDVTVNIDYPDEDIEIITYENLINNLGNVKNQIDELCKTSNSGRIMREGLKVSIVGKPNVGKSSLMNALLKQSRAIVTDIPGTTRDTIEEAIQIKDIPVILTDTAGIRETEDKIEKIGIEKSKEAFNTSDLVVLIIDGSRELEEEDNMLMDYIGNRNNITIINKTDLDQKVNIDEIKEKLPNAEIIETSIANNIGIDSIEDAIEALVYGGTVKQESSLIVTNARHEELLRQALEAVNDAINMSQLGEALEFIEVDINRTFQLLGEIIGESIEEDIINEVFSRFCLGK